MVLLPIYRLLFSHHCKPRRAQSACERASLSVTYISVQTKIYHDMTDLIVQLPPPFILMGDTNAKCELWGGRIFEQLLLNMNIGLLNSRAHTHYHSQIHRQQLILACALLSYCQFSWRVDNVLHGSGGEGGWFVIFRLFKSILFFVKWISLYFFPFLIKFYQIVYYYCISIRMW